MKDLKVKTGEVWYVDLGEYDGSRLGGIRACLIVSNNINNMYSPTVNVVAFTSKKRKKKYPQHAYFKAGECGLIKDSVLEAESIFQIDKKRLLKKIGEMNEEQMTRAATAIAMQIPLLFAYAHKQNIVHNPIFQSLATV